MIAIWRAGLRRLLAPALGVALTVAWCVAGAPAPPAAAATTTITVSGTQGGRTFDGIGAISGGGGNTRLLTHYPAAQQQQILDYLFKPGYGADLQILKVEIGGDTNSTDGSESSIEHASGAVNCGAGYEWWLMEQAQARNPNIKLYGLAWGAPGWIGSTFWSTNTINYIIAWLNCAKSLGLTINYLGGWNERGYNISWYEQLRSTLSADGYSAVQIVGADSDWTIANDLVSNPPSPVPSRSSARTTRAGTCPASPPAQAPRTRWPPASNCGPARTGPRTSTAARRPWPAPTTGTTLTGR